MSKNTKKVNRALLEQFIHDSGVEVTEEELNEILENELNKPAEEIDLQLLDDILNLLEPVKGIEADAALGDIKGKEPENTQRFKTPSTNSGSVMAGVVKYLRAFAIAAAAVVLLFAVSLGTARATRWTFLLKYLEPIAQTFGIYMEDSKEEPVRAGLVHSAEYALSDDDNGMVYYQSADDVPKTFAGYRIRLNHIPDRFSFVTGSFYDDPETKVVNVFYQNAEDTEDGEDKEDGKGEEGWLNYSVYIFTNEEAALGYEYEKTVNEEVTKQVGMKGLTFYHTAEDETLSVSWIDENAHYSIVGHITEEELAEIIEGM